MDIFSLEAIDVLLHDVCWLFIGGRFEKKVNLKLQSL